LNFVFSLYIIFLILSAAVDKHVSILLSSFEGYISVSSSWGLSNGEPLNFASLTMNIYRSKHVVVTYVVCDYLLPIVQVVGLSTV